MKIKEININDIEEFFDYIDKNIFEGDYLEIYFGRVHIEGSFLRFNHGTLEILNEKFGIIEIDLEELYNDDILLEFVHKKENEDKKVILIFY